MKEKLKTTKKMPSFSSCLVASVKKQWLKATLLALVVVGVMLFSLAPAFVLQKLIDTVFNNSGDIILKADLTKTLAIMAAIYLAVISFLGIFELLKQILLSYIGENLMLEIRQTCAKKLNQVYSPYFSSVDSGELTSIIINDVDTINTIFTEGLISLVIDLLKIVGICVSMFLFSYLLGAITLVLIPLIYFISRAFKKRMFTAQLKNRILTGSANNHIAESVKNKQMIKLYSAENFMTNKYDALLKKNYKAVESVNFFDSVYSPIIKSIMVVSIAFILILSGVNIALFGLSAGSLAAGISLIESLFSPVENIGMELQTLQSASAGIKRVNDFLALPLDEEKLDLTLSDIVKDGDITIKFENLTFSYDNVNNIFSNLNLTINNGEKVTFVGRTGAGKSTLFKLILGVIKGSGKITVNGVETCKIKNEIKPYLFGYVEQSFSFISGSIKENLTLFNENLSDSDVEKALTFVGLSNVVSRLPQGKNTPFSTSLFSQGQLQLLSIARAIIYNPIVLLLDEITASLDAETEKLILSVLQKASENHTILSISHKLTSIYKSNKIVEIINGEINQIR